MAECLCQITTHWMRPQTIAQHNMLTPVWASMAHGGASILEGAKGSKKCKCKLGEFDETKWLAVGGDAKCGTDFRRAKPEQHNDASFLFLDKHMNMSLSPMRRRCAENINWYDLRSGGCPTVVAVVRHPWLQLRLSVAAVADILGCSCGWPSSGIRCRCTGE